MDDYISKPFQAAVILSKLSQLAGASVCEPPVAAVCAVADVLDGGKIADLKALMAPGQFCDFITLCVSGAQGHFDQIEILLAAGDRKGAAREAHMLVSVAGNAGAMQLSALARKTEIAASQEPQTVAAVAARMKACLADSLARLRVEVETVRQEERKTARA
jgi:HPt (histidine-containing phosphotransfer) domain-containing protein